jgi:hypothetical protein
MFTEDSTDPAMITIPIEYIDQLKKNISSPFYNNVSPSMAKATISTRFDANEQKPNLADIPYLHNHVTPLPECNVIPDHGLPLISKDTKEANGASIFSSSVNKVTIPVAAAIILSTECEPMLPAEDNIKFRGLQSLLISAVSIPNSLAENSETSSLKRNNSFSKSSVTRSEVFDRVTEYVGAINGGNDPERQVIITQADIHCYPLAWNLFQ